MTTKQLEFDFMKGIRKKENYDFVKRAVKKIVLAESIILGTFFGTDYAVKQAASKYVEPYIRQNLESVMKKQEKTLNMKFDGIPKIEFSEGEIEFKDYYGKGRDSKRGGCYCPKEETIKISKKSCIPEANLLSKIANKYFFVQDAREILRHELGHFYHDKVFKKINGYQDRCTMDTVRLVHEGIAEYFARKGTEQEKSEFKDSDYTRNPRDYGVTGMNNLNIFFNKENKMIYEAGYNLVKPILDKHGMKAVPYLMCNPPQIHSKLIKGSWRLYNKIGTNRSTIVTDDLLDYRQKALRKIGAGK